MNEQQPRRLLLNNWTSLFGVVVLMVSVAAGVVLLIADVVEGHKIQYVVVPYLFAGIGSFVGLVLALIGYLMARRRAKRGEAAHIPFLLRLDLQNPIQRNTAIGVTFVSLFLIGLTGAAAFQAVEYVSSNEFCTQACHSVMMAEGTAYESSPHARVDCVKCHVGSGAEGFAQSKIRGLHQLMATFSGDYHRPIQVPVESMQPARQTCEQCHWSRRWVGFKEKQFTYYASDNENTKSQLRMLMKIGGANSGVMHGEGIHFHMTLGRKVEFIARDANKQDIAWLKMTEPDGTVVEFESDSEPLTEEERSTLTVHQMDCMDCHNRPAHQFQSPMAAINARMAAGAISAEIPAIKLRGVQALSAEYETTDEALSAIDTELREYYANKKSEFYAERKKDVDEAIEQIQDIFAHNYFPEMKSSWKAYPNNLGHRDSPGCFRCHNDDLADSEGNTIFSTCTKCHIVLEQGESLVGDQSRAQTFFHPADDEGLTEYTECSDCHSLGADLY